MSNPTKDAIFRQACLDSPATFAEAMDKDYRASAFHRVLSRKLVDAWERRTRRLVISVPPRHGKSRLTSVMFPAWALAKNPRLEIIQAGYSAKFSKDFASDCKDLMMGDRYRSLFKTEVRGGEAGDWKTTEGGRYFATGIGGAATGKGADLLIIDDPHKNREEANSKVKRDKVWDWFRSTASTRLAPGGILICIHTRWHADDLIGRLTDPKRKRELQEAGLEGMIYEELVLDAICENPATDALGRSFGDPLWPERFDLKALAEIKVEKGNAEWNALYQQRPNPPGGNLCSIKNVVRKRRDEVPKGMRLVRAWDLALSTKSSSDYSVGAYGGLDEAGNFWLVHVDRKKRGWIEQKGTIINYAKVEAPNGGMIGIETVAAWKVAEEELKTHPEIRGKTIVKGYTPDRDKQARAMPWIAKVDAGMFYMVDGLWNQDFLDELEAFGGAVAHDDQIDAVSILFEMVRKKGTLCVA